MLLIVSKKFFLKLMCNSVYGQQKENLRTRINVRLVNNEKDFLKYISIPIHIAHKIFGKNHATMSYLRNKIRRCL